MTPLPKIRVGAGAALILLAGGLADPAAQIQRRFDQSPQIDPKAVAVLEAADGAYSRAEGLTATYRIEIFRPNGQPGSVETATLRLGRPNVYYLEMSSGGRSAREMLASDGTTRFTVRTGNPGHCTTSKVAPLNDAREVDSFNPIYWSFYNLGEWQIRSAMLGHWVTKWRLSDPGLRTLRYVGVERESGMALDVIEWTYTIGYNRSDDDPLYTSRLWIGPDHFVRRIDTTSTSKKEYEGRHIVETMSDIRTTPRPALEQFAYRPPAGLTCTPFNPEDAYTKGSYADLPIGSKAPDFTLKTARGETLRLSVFLKQHKVVLMNYWGYG